MARRKRLSLETTSPDGMAPPALPPMSTPARAAPIAQVAGDSAAQAALDSLTRELEAARASGRLILSLPLYEIDADHLTRDRMEVALEDMEDLVSSLRARGQQVPIEVTALPGGGYGLISGWRRLSALRYLNSEAKGAEFTTVLALVRQPADLAETYRAMVEENEIRAGISYFERARLAALVAQAGIYPDAKAAIAGLFAAASRAKRSKIGSFLLLYEGLGTQLRFGAAISERLGLALARAIEAEPGFARRLSDRLRKADIAEASAELALLEKALAAAGARPTGREGAVQEESSPEKTRAEVVAPHANLTEVSPGIFLETTGRFSRATLTLSGPKVDTPLRERLIAWLQNQG